MAGVNYAYPWSELITRYKFGDKPGWAPFFADVLLKSPGVAQAFALLRPDDLIIPIPLSVQRLQLRGFNQACELASALAKKSHSGGKIDPHLLLRVRHTLPQTELRREARLANVKGAFQIDPLRVPELNGRRVLLVDDVMTSGASIFTAAEVLRSAGAANVSAVVLARTPQPHNSAHV
jgi:ComF family protein